MDLLAAALMLVVDQAPAPAKAVPEARAARVSTAPRIDGRLDDPAWQAAPPITGFRQREPTEGAEASEPTTVRIVYDQTHLYIAAELTDSTPTEIRASELRRDNTLDSDDSFAVLLDTHHDHRNAFVFRINARGTRYDAQVRNESRFYYAEWDEQWTAAATLTDRGWSAELAIPFKILRFSGAAEQTWGLNFERIVKRKNEQVYWAGWVRDFTFQNVSQAGHLAGLRDIRQAERLRLRPYVVAGAEKIEATASPGPSASGIGKIGIDDLKIAVTSTLTADVAVNPDFAQTEADTQQVNLTRFNLFFSEKRQFFIEGAESLRMGVGVLHLGPPPLEVFHSRNIGLSSDGVPIPVNAGGKLTGKVAGFDVGIVTARTGRSTRVAAPGATPASFDGESFTVGRVRKEVLGRSYVGAIVTNRQGNGARNTVVGADARLTFFRNFTVAGLVARSDDRARSQPDAGVPAARTSRGRAEWATQIGAHWQGDLVEAGANYIDVDPEFTPGLGFVRFRERLIGVRGSFRPRPRRGGVRQFELAPQVLWYHDDQRLLRSREGQFTFATAFESGDRLELFYRNNFERVARPFPIGPGVQVPVDLYEWNTAGVTYRFYNGRPASGAVTVSRGSFYAGDRQTLNLQGDLRPSRLVSFNPTYEVNDVRLPHAAFRTHLAGLRANVSLSTSLLTSAYLQYNSAGQLAATQVRFNYIFRTIDNLYVVFNDVRYTEGPFAGRSNRSLLTKVTYSWHR